MLSFRPEVACSSGCLQTVLAEIGVKTQVGKFRNAFKMANLGHDGAGILTSFSHQSSILDSLVDYIFRLSLV